MTVETISILGLADIAFRGGTVAILLLLIIHLLVRLDGGPVVVAGLAFCATGAIEAVVNVPVDIIDLGLSPLTQLALKQLHFVSMWLFVLALFDDRFSWRPVCFWPLALAVPLTLGGGLLTGQAGLTFSILLVAFDVALLAMLVRSAVTDEASDLVPARRAFRRALTFTVPPFSLFVFLTSSFNDSINLTGPMCTAYSAIYFLLSIGFGFWLTSAKRQMLVREEPGEQKSVRESEFSAADRLELDRLQKAVAGGLYLEPGLTIGALGDILDIPEHRLRRLINKGLGYRNFAAFVNDFRIEEAKRRLADPEKAREQIVQHAFSLGYASLAPFNRAFRERVGVSPTEFRETALAGAAE